MHRQIFSCSVGGYDTHTNQVTINANTGVVTPTTGTHANLLGEVSDCVFAFQRAMEQLGASNERDTFSPPAILPHFPDEFARQRPAGWGGRAPWWLAVPSKVARPMAACPSARHSMDRPIPGWVDGFRQRRSNLGGYAGKVVRRR